MKVVNKKYIGIIMILILVEITMIFLCVKSYSNKNINVKLDNVLIKKEEKEDMFAIMVEQEDGTYLEYDKDTFPEGYILNEKLSGCINQKGLRLDGVLEYDSATNILTINSGMSMFCYLYFDFFVVEIQNFNYTGGVQTYVVPHTGYYQLETWGAQGGVKVAGGSSTIGYGGYATGAIYLQKNTELYITVGGQGNTTSSAGVKVAGGYNGGGIGYSYNGDTRGGASGGGATHIARNNNLGELFNYSDNKDDLLIVAGGGGGSDQCCNGYSKVPGSGGGYIGTNGTYTSSTVYGGSQTLGGSGNFSGSFGQGANCTSNDCAGGGGGYYGGGANTGGGGYGGGGSGYIGNSDLKSKYMACYNCDTSSDISTKTINTINSSLEPTANMAKAGNGHAKISYIGKDLNDIYINIKEITTSSINVEVGSLISNSLNTYYYSINDGDYVESTSNTYTFTGLTKGTEYNIKIYAIDSNGNRTSTIGKKISTLSELILYDSGIWSNGLTGISLISGAGAVALNTDSIQIRSNANGNFSFSGSIDVTNYNSLKIYISSITMTAYSGNSSNYTFSCGGNSGYHSVSDGMSNITISINLENITGSQNLTLKTYGHELAQTYAYITKIWLN